MRNNLIWLAIVGCVQPELGIDNTRVTGQVRIEPVRISEAELVGGMGTTTTMPGTDVEGLGAPTQLPTLYVATQFLTGTLEADATDGTADVDGYLIDTRLTLSDEVFHVTLDGPGTVLVELYDMNRYVAGSPLLLGAVSVTESGDLVFPDVELGEDSGFFLSDSGVAAGARMVVDALYGLRISGEDAITTGYEIRMPAAHPRRAEIKVGAYQSDDPTALGNPVGGSDVLGWRGGNEAREWAWVGGYDMRLLRTVVDDPDADPDADPPPIPTVTEGVDKAWLFAGDFATLNAPLASGTFYSATPLELVVPDEEPKSTWFQDAVLVEIAEPLLVDTIATAIVVNEFVEDETAEPENGFSATWPPDVPGAVDLGSGSSVPDVGLLAGPGFADVFRGSITYGAGDSGYPGYGYDHDTDSFAFQVPEPCRIVVSLSWDDAAACLDIYVTDDVEGIGLDWAATFDLPDVGGGVHIYEPDTTYFLTVLGYYGEPEGASTEYEVLVEQPL